MYHIAILEDDPQDRDLLRGFIERYGKENDQTFKVSEFANAVNFLTGYNPIYDMIFVDIQMPYIDGMQAAAKLRETDADVPLVFITSMSNYAVKGYAVDAVDFIIKPVPYSVFSVMMNKALRIAASASESIMLKTQNGKIKLRLDSISHIEVLDHKTCYHTDGGDRFVWGSLKEQEDILPGDKFAKCNNYCIINLKYVDGITDNSVIMRGGDRIPISRSKKKELTDKILAYYGRYV